MLAIIHHDNRISVRLTGRLVGTWAEELKYAAYPANALDIDLSGGTFVDRDGEHSLVWLRSMGAKFRGEGLFAQTLCRRMRIPLSK